MKNRRIFLGVAILPLTLGIVSVSLGGSLRETLLKRTNSPTTLVAPSGNRPSQATAARAERTASNSLVDPLNLERLKRGATLP